MTEEGHRGLGQHQGSRGSPDLCDGTQEGKSGLGRANGDLGRRASRVRSCGRGTRDCIGKTFGAPPTLRGFQTQEKVWKPCLLGGV